MGSGTACLSRRDTWGILRVITMQATDPAADNMMQAPWGVVLKAWVPWGEPTLYINRKPHTTVALQAPKGRTCKHNLTSCRFYYVELHGQHSSTASRTCCLSACVMGVCVTQIKAAALQLVLCKALEDTYMTCETCMQSDNRWTVTCNSALYKVWLQSPQLNSAHSPTATCEGNLLHASASF